MERLDGSVRRALRGVGVPDAGQVAELTAAWPAAVGDAIARAAWPQRVSRDGTLVVATSSSTWAFELGRMAPEILEKLREAVPGAAPTGLKFVPGPVPEPPAPLPAEGGPGAPRGRSRGRPRGRQGGRRDRGRGAAGGGGRGGCREPRESPRRPGFLID